MTESTGSRGAKEVDVNRKLEAGKLYAVLTYREEVAWWDWAFFIPDPSHEPIGKSGMVYTIIQESREPISWRYVAKEKDVLTWSSVVTVVELANLKELGNYQNLIAGDGLPMFFQHVDIPKSDPSDDPDLSRVWFRNAVGLLNDCFVLSCKKPEDLEREIRLYAFDAMVNYLQHESWPVLKANNCS